MTLEDPQSLNTIKRAEKPEFLTNTRFDDLNIPQKILDGLNEAGFTFCTPIQAQTLPVSLEGKDVAGQAQTGTGKTAAFMVTVLTRLLFLPKRNTNKPSALIVAPTRELALQIYHDAKIIGRHTGLNLAQVVGGIDYRKQANILRKGTDIVICTPGRIIDYIKQGIFHTDRIQMVVIDEADRLFDLGFTKDMRYILRKLPHYEKRQSMLFSATLSYRVLALTYDYMNLPEFISVIPDEVTVDGVDQKLFHIGKREKLSLLLGFFEKEDSERILIFVNTKSGVEWLAQKLKGNKLPAEGITGDVPQRKRLRLMERFKDGRTKILVATDVASRGIHVEDISHAINYDIPQDPENYIHRIGRTARAGKKGVAISFACEEYVFHLEPIEDLLGYKIPVIWPENDWFIEDRAGPVRTYRTGPKKTPTRRRQSNTGKKRPTRKKRAQKPTASPQPGGIFGLAPESKTDQSSKTTTNIPEKKKRKRRPRKRPTKKAEPNASQS